EVYMSNDDPRSILGRTASALPTERLQQRARQSDAALKMPKLDARAAPAQYPALKAVLHARLLDELDRRNMLAAGEEELSLIVREFVTRVLAEEELTLNADERRQLPEDLLEETLGIGPLAPLMSDPAVTDILVNGPDNVYIERF